MWVPARRRLGAAVAIGLLAATVPAVFAAWQITVLVQIRVLVSWCATAGVFVGLTYATMLSADGHQTRVLASRADESRATADLILVVARVASLVGVGLILLKASSAAGVAEAAMTGLGVVSVVLAWATVHTVYTLRYADLYYGREESTCGDDGRQREATGARRRHASLVDRQVSRGIGLDPEPRSLILRSCAHRYLHGRRVRSQPASGPDDRPGPLRGSAEKNVLA